MSKVAAWLEKISPKVTIARFSGVFEGMEALNSAAEIRDVLWKADTPSVWMDFSKIEYLDSAAISVMIEWAKAALSRNLKLSVFNVNRNVKKVLLVTHVDKIIPILNDENS